MRLPTGRSRAPRWVAWHMHIQSSAQIGRADVCSSDLADRAGGRMRGSRRARPRPIAIRRAVVAPRTAAGARSAARAAAARDGAPSRPRCDCLPGAQGRRGGSHGICTSRAPLRSEEQTCALPIWLTGLAVECVDHGVLALDPSQYDELLSLHEQQLALDLRLERLLRATARLLDRDAIAYRALKGAAVGRMAYAHPELRSDRKSRRVLFRSG